MIAFPLAATVLAAACAAVVALDGLRRPKPDKAAWFVAFVLFAVAAGTEVVGSALGWSPLLARVYYLAGAVLVVGFLALGELYLLIPGRIARVAPGVALLVTALAATAVLDAPVDAGRLATDGWRAIERGPVLVALAVGINVAGSAVLVGGALWSAVRLARLGVHRHRTIGCVLIALGTLAVAAGGSSTRLGNPDVLYFAMTAGIALIFAWYLEARRRDDGARMALPFELRGASQVSADLSDRPVALVLHRGGSDVAADEGLALIGEWLADLDGENIAMRCRAWSAAEDESPMLTRPQARQVWALRLRLRDGQKRHLDALSPTVQRQLAEVYFGVFAAPAASDAGSVERARQAAG